MGQVLGSEKWLLATRHLNPHAGPLRNAALQNLATLTGKFITEEFGLNLEKASITVIQIDEAALREVLPFRKSEHAFYLDWAVHSFRITNCEFPI
ncbi:unnamed protein product, partial [Vitis vinifera]